MVRERIFSMVMNSHSTLRIIYQDMAGSMGCFIWRSKQSFTTGFLNYLTYSNKCGEEKDWVAYGRNYKDG